MSLLAPMTLPSGSCEVAIRVPGLGLCSLEIQLCSTHHAMFLCMELHLLRGRGTFFSNSLIDAVWVSGNPVFPFVLSWEKYLAALEDSYHELKYSSFSP